jgi:hypothetical protein
MFSVAIVVPPFSSKVEESGWQSKPGRKQWTVAAPLIGDSVARTIAKVPLMPSPVHPPETMHTRQWDGSRVMPVTLLFPHPFFTVADQRVAGLSSPYRADPVRYAEHLWLDEPGSSSEMNDAR